MTIFILVVAGLLAGVLAGLLGIGGGIIIVPVLVYLLGYSQRSAQGTTLALLCMPVGFFAAWAYHKAGYVNIKATLLLATGFVVGSFITAHFATHINDKTLTKAFGAFLILVGLRTLL